MDWHAIRHQQQQPIFLHGTGISLFQYPSFELEGEERKFNKKYYTTKNIKKVDVVIRKLC